MEEQEINIFRDVICNFCGSCCDDLEIHVSMKDNRILETRNACRISHEKFISAHSHRLTTPLLRKNNEFQEISFEEAIDRTVDALNAADRPLLFGWSTMTTEAIRHGIELAEILGAAIDNSTSVCHGPSTLAVQEVGFPSCSLGEIKNRADLVIYWGSNPIHAHPRHMSRYSIFPRGYFRERASKDRKRVIIDPRETASAHQATLYIQVEPGKDFELLAALRTTLRTGRPPKAPVAGVPPVQIEELLELCLKATFGIIFFGVGLTMSSGRHRNIDAAISLVIDLNEKTKFSIMPMRGHGNVKGACAVFTWLAGYPFSIDFSRRYARYNPGEYSAVDILARKEADVAMILGADPASHFPSSAARHLFDIPTIFIAPHWAPTMELSQIVIPAAMSGVEVEGTIYRMDGVPFRLRRVIEPPEGVFSDEYILEVLLKRLKETE